MTLLGIDRSEVQAEAERLEQTIEGVLRRIVTRTDRRSTHCAEARPDAATELDIDA